MKTFNLQAMLNGEPVVTREGKRIIDFKYWVHSSDTHKLHTMDEDFNHRSYDDLGSYFGNNHQCEHDLFMETGVRKSWIAIERKGNRTSIYSYNTREALLDNGLTEDKYHFIEVEMEE